MNTSETKTNIVKINQGFIATNELYAEESTWQQQISMAE